MPKMFKLPEPIHLVHPSTKEKLDGDMALCSLRRVFNESLVNVPGVWQGHKALRAANKIEDAIEAAEGNDGTVVLDSEHYELLKKAVEHDTALDHWVPQFRRQLLPHLDAILDATDYIAPAVRKAE